MIHNFNYKIKIPNNSKEIFNKNFPIMRIMKKTLQIKRQEENL